MAVPGMSVRRCPHYIGRPAGHLESRASSVASDATSGGRPGASRGQAAARVLCRGAARSAALRGGPAGRRKQVILGSPDAEDDPPPRTSSWQRCSRPLLPSRRAWRPAPHRSAPPLALPGPGHPTGSGLLDDSGPSYRPVHPESWRSACLTGMQPRTLAASGASQLGFPSLTCCAVICDQLNRQG
jgi:hypothetical protein